MSRVGRAFRTGMGAITGGPALAAGMWALRSRRGVRWGKILGLIAVLVSFMIITALVQFPSTVANTATAWMFGAVDRADVPSVPIPQICGAPPKPAPNPAPPVPSEVAADEEQPTAAESSPPLSAEPAPQPRPGLDPEGRATPEAMAVIGQIPLDTEADVAMGWILYRMAHPAGNDPLSSFEQFRAGYNNTADTLSRGVEPLQVVATIDPNADYAPYLLLAQTGTFRLMGQGSVKATEQQAGELVAAIGRTCKPEETDAAAAASGG